MNELNIRECTQRDLKQLAQIFIEAFREAPWHEEWPYDTAYKRLEMVMQTPRFVGYIAELDGEVMGGLLGNIEYWSEGDHYIIKELFVDKEKQGRGIARLLIGNVREELKRQGICIEELVTSNSVKMINFYKNQGYSVNEEMVMMIRKKS